MHSYNGGGLRWGGGLYFPFMLYAIITSVEGTTGFAGIGKLYLNRNICLLRLKIRTGTVKFCHPQFLRFQRFIKFLILNLRLHLRC